MAYAIDEAGTIRAMEAALAQAQDHARHARHGWIDSTPICLIVRLRPAPTS